MTTRCQQGQGCCPQAGHASWTGQGQARQSPAPQAQCSSLSQTRFREKPASLPSSFLGVKEERAELCSTTLQNKGRMCTLRKGLLVWGKPQEWSIESFTHVRHSLVMLWGVASADGRKGGHFTRAGLGGEAVD